MRPRRGDPIASSSSGRHVGLGASSGAWSQGPQNVLGSRGDDEGMLRRLVDTLSDEAARNGSLVGLI